MASEKDLVTLMKSRKRLWKPCELCLSLGITVCQLVRLVERARNSGTALKLENGEHTGFTSKYWLVEG
ncbi:hypothetical protein [Vibrio ziniensis]|uniref:MarR family transcriptional regulator n=1 Tax=Vibrio ziniensis TaxID=2711221 RepID=A0A6G7CH78_9VIBR|nr:hypothetical protein [Vibrio ziniensis]QIH41430.1 hypothetical protein G5S32_05210 [Vibrio ziniensis]